MKSVAAGLSMTVLAALTTACGGGGNDNSQVTGSSTLEPVVAGLTGYSLVWQDEFETAGLPDEAKWDYDTYRNPQWHNNELQYYTARRLENSRIESGSLKITALDEPFSSRSNWGGKQYTSTRLVTRGKAEWTYGHFEIRAKLPCAIGTWPAIWMLPSNPFKFATTCDASVPEWQGNADCDAWPNSGEIDIMEHVGFDPGVVHGTVHTKAYYWANWNQHKGSIVLPDFDQFHRYQLIWTADQITWLVDDIPYFSYVRESQDWAAWPFSEPFHLILNLAMGGNWGRAGGPIDNLALPARMEVDYVRVYASEPDGSKSLAPE